MLLRILLYLVREQCNLMTNVTLLEEPKSLLGDL